MPTCPNNLTTWKQVDDKTLIKKDYYDKDYSGTIAGIRQAIDKERIRRAKSAWSWTPITSVTPLNKKIIFEEFYKSLADIYTSPGVCTTYVAPTGTTYEQLCEIENIVPDVNKVRVAHMNLLHTRINDLEDDCISHNTSYNTGYNTGYNTSNYSNYSNNASDLRSDYKNNSADYVTDLTSQFASYNTSYLTSNLSSNLSVNYASKLTSNKDSHSPCGSENRA